VLASLRAAPSHWKFASEFPDRVRRKRSKKKSGLFRQAVFFRGDTVSRRAEVFLRVKSPAGLFGPAFGRQISAGEGGPAIQKPPVGSSFHKKRTLFFASFFSREKKEDLQEFYNFALSFPG